MRPSGSRWVRFNVNTRTAIPPGSSAGNYGRGTEALRGGFAAAGLVMLQLFVARALALGHALLELLRGLPERTGQVRQLLRSEQEQHDPEDDDELGKTQVHDSTLPSVPEEGPSSGVEPTAAGSSPSSFMCRLISSFTS